MNVKIEDSVAVVANELDMNAGVVTSNDESGSPTDSKVPAATPASFKIGAQEFADKGEMEAYVNKLEGEKNAAEAYSRGLKDSMVSQMGGKEEKPADNLESLQDDFFTDPAAVLARMKAEAKAEVKDEWRAENQVIKNQDAAYASFYRTNPDLQSRSDLMDAMVEKYSKLPEYKGLSMTEGLSKVGALLRKQLGTDKELSSTPVTMTSASNAAGVTPNDAVSDEPLDMVTQMRKTQRRK